MSGKRGALLIEPGYATQALGSTFRRPYRMSQACSSNIRPSRRHRGVSCAHNKPTPVSKQRRLDGSERRRERGRERGREGEREREGMARGGRADRRYTLGGPGRRRASCGTGAGGRSTGEGGGLEPRPGTGAPHG